MLKKIVKLSLLYKINFRLRSRCSGSDSGSGSGQTGVDSTPTQAVFGVGVRLRLRMSESELWSTRWLWLLFWKPFVARFQRIRLFEITTSFDQVKVDQTRLYSHRPKCYKCMPKNEKRGLDENTPLHPLYTSGVSLEWKRVFVEGSRGPNLPNSKRVNHIPYYLLSCELHLRATEYGMGW